MQKRLILMLLLFMVVSVSLFAGTTGKLAGKISAKDGSPVPFANIVLVKDGEGVTGGQTKENGTYFIINIPPGTYEMRVSQGSFHPATVTGILINLDETSVANAELTPSFIAIEGMVISENKNV